MVKKSLAGVIIIAIVGGGILYTSKQHRKVNNLTEENKKLEIKIQTLKKELNNKETNLTNTRSLLKARETEVDQLKKEKEELTKKVGRAQNFTLTFYSTLPQENGGYTTTCNGEIPRHGMVASNYYPQGTKIKINGKIFIVADRGGKSFNKPNRLDVVVERKPGESDKQYLKRVEHLGKIKVTGYILGE
jgi:DNA repair exonuclease SbcCD ATPase subunit